MNTQIRFLQQLEDDLAQAAGRQTEHAAANQARPIPMASRRRPRRERHWGAVAAAVAALLVLAGSIGFLSQRGGGGNDSGPAASSIQAPLKQTDLAGDASSNVGDEATAPGLGAGTAGEPDSAQGFGLAPAAQTPPADLAKIVRDGRIGLLLDNDSFDNAVTAVTFVARSNRGMILSSATQNEASGQFTLRIPAKHFDRAMLQLRALGRRAGNSILFQDVTGQDVTAQFVDDQARLRILKGQRTLLVGLRDSATTVEAILSLSGRIAAVQLQIEQIQGQLNVINDQVAESTIKVELREKDAPESQTTTDDVEHPSLGSAWDQALRGFLLVVGAVIVGLGYLVPLGALALAIWAAIALARRRRAEAG